MKKYRLFYLFLFISQCIFSQTTMNYALNFNGSDEYVSTSSTALTTYVSVEAWVKTNSSTGDQRIVSMATSSSNSDIEFILALNTSDEPYFKVVESDGSSNATATSSSALTSQWAHVAGIYDGTDIKVYVNGVETGTASLSGTINTHSCPIDIAGYSYSKAGEYFDGMIDEVRIWSNVRTLTELRGNMFRELAGNESGLFAYYKMSDGSGSSLDDDKSGGTLDGSMTNMGDINWVTSACFSGPRNCLAFDGTEDNYVEVPDWASFPFSNQITLEAWVKLTTGSNGDKIIFQTSNGGQWTSTCAYGLIFNGTTRIPTFIVESNVLQATGLNLPESEWHHIAGVFDRNTDAGATTDMKIYVDGILINSMNQDNLITDPGTQKCYIGGFLKTGSVYQPFHGSIDEVRIWSTARTETEIRENMCRTLDGDETGLKAYYRFDLDPGTGQTTLFDITTNNHNGTMTNMDATADWTASTAFNTWEGSISTSPSTAGNWSRNTVPGATDHVGIYSYTGGNNCVVPSGKATLNAYNMTISSESYVTLQSGGATSIANNLFINSDIAATGALINENTSGGITISGDAYIQRYISQTDWHMLSAPISDQSISTEFVDISGTISSDVDWYKYYEPNNIWINIKADDGTYNQGSGDTYWSNDADPLFEPGRGYLVAYGDAEYCKNFIGTLNDGSLTTGTGLPSLDFSEPDPGYQGWNLLGNPYPSAIDWDDIPLPTDLDLQVQVYDGASGNYKYWTRGGTGTLPDGIIAPTQGWYVRATSASATLSLDNDSRTWATPCPYKHTPSDVLHLHIAGNNKSDDIIVRFVQNATEDFDSEFDANKMTGDVSAPQFYTMLNGISYSLNALPIWTDKFTVPLYLTVGADNTYEISLEENTLSSITSADLQDLKTGTFTNLNSSATYSFTAYENDDPYRFLLHFNGISDIEEIIPHEQITVYYHNNQLIIKNPDEFTGTIRINDISGRVCDNFTLTGNAVQTQAITYNPGIYIVNISTNKSQKSYKIFITR